jgi:hypothetical protein
MECCEYGARPLQQFWQFQKMWHVVYGVQHEAISICGLHNFQSFAYTYSKTLHAAQSRGMQLGAYHIPVRAGTCYPRNNHKTGFDYVRNYTASVINQDWDQFSLKFINSL